MIKLNEIKPAAGANKNSKRVGRGQGNGKGCTAGMGNNGHKARSGSGTKPYFEGGQTPLTRRIPKRGFHNSFGIDYQVVNLDQLAAIDAGGKEITAELLHSRGLIMDKDAPVKVLGGGELTRPITVRASAFSKSAKEKIEKAKGKAEVKARA